MIGGFIVIRLARLLAWRRWKQEAALRAAIRTGIREGARDAGILP